MQSVAFINLKVQHHLMLLEDSASISEEFFKTFKLQFQISNSKFEIQKFKNQKFENSKIRKLSTVSEIETDIQDSNPLALLGNICMSS